MLVVVLMAFSVHVMLEPSNVISGGVLPSLISRAKMELLLVNPEGAVSVPDAVDFKSRYANWADLRLAIGSIPLAVLISIP